jgi:hypothetical protein
MYYMGVTALDIRINANMVIKRKSIETREAIINAVTGYIDEHNNKDSVWNAVNQKSEEECKVCQDRLDGDFRTIAHGLYSLAGISINSFALDSKIYDFQNKATGKSKIYKIDNKYVKGVCGGVRIDAPMDDDTCYELKDKEDKITGTIKGVDTNINVCGGSNGVGYVRVSSWYSGYDNVAKIQIKSDIPNVKYGKCFYGFGGINEPTTVMVIKSLPAPGIYHIYITSGFVDDGYNGGYSKFFPELCFNFSHNRLFLVFGVL